MAETTLSPAVNIEDSFIQRWGDMGETWGINRTMAEIQGLLYITGASLCADDIMDRLNISRGSASMALRSLVDWGVVRKARVRGDRKDYYHSLSDVWEIFTTVVRQRKRREIDPIVASLRECQRQLDQEVKEGKEQSHVCRERLEQMLKFLSTMDDLSQRFIQTDRGLVQVVGLLVSQK